MKKLLISAALGFLALSGAVIAQAISVPTVSTVNPTADRVQIVPNGQPSARSVYASPAQISGDYDYYRSAPASLFTFTFDNTQHIAAFKPSGTIAYGYVTLAPNPSDGTEECIFSTQTITTLYLSANTNQTLDSAVTTLAANTRNCYIYGLSAATWYRTN